MIVRFILRAFGRLQRPLAWVALGYGVATLIGTVFRLIAQGEPHFTAIGVAAVVFLEGFAAVAEVENEIDSEASADDGTERPVERKLRLGPQDQRRLDEWGRNLRECFGHTVYLVGSCARREPYRDVDVRLILPDEEFDALFGGPSRPMATNRKWAVMCTAFTYYGWQATGLNIDFQIDRQTQANAQHDGPRWALVMADLEQPPPIEV